MLDLVPIAGPKVPLNLFNHERDSSQGQHRMAVFEDCQANTLTTRPPHFKELFKIIFFVKLMFGRENSFSDL